MVVVAFVIVESSIMKQYVLDDQELQPILNLVDATNCASCFVHPKLNEIGDHFLLRTEVFIN